MITKENLLLYIQKSMPNATVEINDRTGTLDHFRLSIVSDLFRGQNLLDRQRLVYRALEEPMKDGRIHALEIRAATPEEHALNSR